MKIKAILVLFFSLFCCFCSASDSEFKTISNEERAKNTIGVFKAEIEPLKNEVKTELEKSIAASLKKNSYKIIELSLNSTTKSEMARADIVVTRPIKKASEAYSEIQRNLAEIQEICVNASTINGKCHLENMTRFVYVHPKNSYKYVKTLLR